MTDETPPHYRPAPAGHQTASSQGTPDSVSCLFVLYLNRCTPTQLLDFHVMTPKGRQLWLNYIFEIVHPAFSGFQEKPAMGQYVLTITNVVDFLTFVIRLQQFAHTRSVNGYWYLVFNGF